MNENEMPWRVCHKCHYHQISPLFYPLVVSNVDFRLTNLEGERAELSSESHPQSLISGPYKQSSSEADYSQTNEGQ